MRTTDKFENIEEEKRKRIINAAMKTFATDGYKKASTNEIILEANISKGILFHYFGSKMKLFEYLYKYSVELMTERIFEKVDFTETDPIKRIYQVLFAKLKLTKEYPDVFDFAKTAYYEKEPNVQKFISTFSNDILSESYSRVFKDINVKVFRKELDPGMILQTIIATLENWSKSYMEAHKELSVAELEEKEMLAAINSYMDFFRKSFYEDKGNL